MKKFILLLILLPIFGFSQEVLSPRLEQTYTTSSMGYPGCYDKNTFFILLDASTKTDYVTYNKLMQSGDCVEIRGNQVVTVVNKLMDGDVVQITYANKKSTIWTVREVLKFL